jgi:two-component system chemotaxis response regulator CheV
MERSDSPVALDGNELELIEFYIDEAMPDESAYRGYFGMNVAKVLEIIRKPPVTGVPGKHHKAALGTFNLRGRVLPLVDLSLWLGKKAVESANNKVIVSEFSSVITAFVVSGVTRIHRITWNQVEPPGKYLQAFSHDSITGVIRFDERIVFLLDMEQIISSMDPSLNLTSHMERIAPTDGSGFHILVADDSPSIRATVSRCLEQARFTVTKTTCGREAWDQLKEWEQQAARDKIPLTRFVNLVVSDIEMPEMDGHTLTRKIKDDAVLRQLPVILFSSLISDVVREKGRKAGADDQISKPDLPRLTVCAHDLIQKSLRPEE